MSGLEEIGLNEEEFIRAKVVAKDLVEALGKHDLTLISALTSLTLVIGGIISRLETEESRDAVVKITHKLLSTAMKTHAFMADRKKETIN